MCETPCTSANVYFKVIADTPMWPVNTVLTTEGSGRNDRLAPVHEFFNKTKCTTQVISVEFATENPTFFERVYKSPTKKMLFVVKETFVNMITGAAQASGEAETGAV